MSKKRGGHGPHEEHADESWLIPYADLLTLLLALFIALYAASNVDAEKIQAYAEAWRGNFAGTGAGSGLAGWEFNKPSSLPSGLTDLSLYVPLPPAAPEAIDETQELLEMQRVSEELTKHFEEEGMTPNIEVRIDPRGLVITLRESLLFDSGKANIKPQYMDQLVKTGEIINRLENYIRVEGHTDDVPMTSGEYDTNWELSTARATSVVRLFTDRSGIPGGKVSAVGFGEWRPLEDNSTPEGRAKNRRVDIILLSGKYNALEDADEQ